MILVNYPILYEKYANVLISFVNMKLLSAFVIMPSSQILAYISLKEISFSTYFVQNNENIRQQGDN
jgi:hypothetical protein